jgi:hypothetical protein
MSQGMLLDLRVIRQLTQEPVPGNLFLANNRQRATLTIVVPISTFSWGF